MSPLEIIDKLNLAVLTLGRGNEELKRLGEIKAKTRRDYAVALNQEILKLKSEDTRATYMIELAKGNEKVADLRLKKDIAECCYFAALDSQNVLKMEIEILRSQLSFLKAEMENVL